MDTDFQYYAFISYKSEDEKWAKWLQRKLETYRLPSVIRKAVNDGQKQLKIFRDKTDLRSGQLHSELRRELEVSKFLIVICSPRSAQSQWVGREIDAFIKIGRGDNIIPFIVEGFPYSNNEDTECYHKVLKDAYPELLGILISDTDNETTWTKRNRAFIKVLSRLLDVEFDKLWNRHRRRRIKILILRCILCVAILASIIIVWKANQPFTANISVKESEIHNANLPPLKNAEISICLGKETKTLKIADEHGIAEFRNVPAKFRGEKVQVKFSMAGFSPVDTFVDISGNKVVLNIRRDNTYGLLGGIIIDDNGSPVVGAKIAVAGITSESDVNGHFRIIIPLALQTEEPKVTVTKAGFTPKTYEGQAISNDWQIMLSK
ncbi:MAG: TIR domain-containing protein [Muribaculaceae bacterium]|jgi:uncharacterized protein YpmB|nr:TIR domain-containing protein [Muribaculaceae bacterium]